MPINHTQLTIIISVFALQIGGGFRFPVPAALSVRLPLL